MHIWMEYFGQKAHLWRLQRVLLRDSERKLEYTTFIWSFRRSLNLQNSEKY